MKVYLFNDTTNGHAGSKETMKNLYNILADDEIISTHTVGEFDYDRKALQSCDAVVMNGEGSIHHNNKKARFLMNVLAEAQRFGRLTYLINTTYQDMPQEYDDVLNKLTFLSVREYASFQYIREKGILTHINVDLSINTLYPRQGASVGKKRCIGEAHPDTIDSMNKIKELKGERVLLNGRTFQQVISYLYHHAKIYLTGQYHGVIAGLMAGCYVSPYPSNSWKIEGLMMWAKAMQIHPKELLLKAPRLTALPKPEGVL